MSAEAWIALGLGLGLPFVASWCWLIWQLRRVLQTLYGSNGESMVKVVERSRRDGHWLANCVLILSLTAKVELPERPSLK